MTVTDVNWLVGSFGEMGPGGHGVIPYTWTAGGNEIYIHFDQWTRKATEAFFTGADGKQRTRRL